MPKCLSNVINSEGTWVQVSQPPGKTSREPNTVPVAIPGAPVVSSDPYDFPDAVWRDPSLANKNTTLVFNIHTQVFPVVEPPPESELRAPAARTTATAASTGRRASYKARRRAAPYPPEDPSSVIPHTPSEHSAPEEEVEEHSAPN